VAGEADQGADCMTPHGMRLIVYAEGEMLRFEGVEARFPPCGALEIYCANMLTVVFAAGRWSRVYLERLPETMAEHTP
jgi:hypothetical protein